MKNFIPILVVLVGAGCTSIPDVDVTYYPTSTKVDVTVSQTVLCYEVGSNGNKTWKYNRLSGVEFKNKYRADYSKPGYTLDYGELKSITSDATASISLTEDGRLSGINGSTEGTGQALVEGVSALTSVFGKSSADQNKFVEITPRIQKSPAITIETDTKVKNECEKLKTWTSDKTQVLLTVKRHAVLSFNGINSNEIWILGADKADNVDVQAMTTLFPDVLITQKKLIADANKPTPQCGNKTECKKTWGSGYYPIGVLGIFPSKKT